MARNIICRNKKKEGIIKILIIETTFFYFLNFSTKSTLLLPQLITSINILRNNSSDIS